MGNENPRRLPRRRPHLVAWPSRTFTNIGDITGLGTLWAGA
jgi:hypothetical protein